MKLTEHFSREEFEIGNQMPEYVVPTYEWLCKLILEPVRAYYEKPVKITSGYRSAAANAAAGGVVHSQHEATEEFCAADWLIPDQDMRQVFDWLRLRSGLPFDQLILEHGVVSAIIHTSWDATLNRREALEGKTANRGVYKRWPVI